MDRSDQPKNAGASKRSPNSGRLEESKTSPAKIPNKMKFVRSNKLRKSLGNYKPSH